MAVEAVLTDRKVDELEKAITVAAKDPALYGIDEAELERRRRWTSNARTQGVPNLIIGNYSDGNLVASLLACKLGVIQCNIAHALEKTKYPESDIYWRNHEDKYHFASQFTADLIAINNADFIITSTY